jgi:hypothetical protein
MLNVIAYRMMLGCSAMIAETSRMTPPPFSPNRQHVAAFLCHDERSNFKKRTNEAGMSMKTKERCGKLVGKAGMSMKIKALSPLKREC